jgi:hypothetical protein
MVFTTDVDQIPAHWCAEKEAAYHFLRAWFLARYENPVENCPVEAGESLFVFGGPYDAGEELLSAWEGVFTDAFLDEAAHLLCTQEDCWYWSAVPPAHADW